jgi:hypothetical protein
MAALRPPGRVSSVARRASPRSLVCHRHADSEGMGHTAVSRQSALFVSRLPIHSPLRWRRKIDWGHHDLLRWLLTGQESDDPSHDLRRRQEQVIIMASVREPHPTPVREATDQLVDVALRRACVNRVPQRRVVARRRLFDGVGELRDNAAFNDQVKEARAWR